jgi:hypothetical protein
MREAVDAWLALETKNTTCRLEKSWVSRIWTPLFNHEYIYLNEKSRTAWLASSVSIRGWTSCPRRDDRTSGDLYW